MSIKDKGENLLEEYFKNYRETIPDNGFTKSTIGKIPKTESGFSVRDLLTTASLIIGFSLVIFNLDSIGDIFIDQNFYLLLFVFCCFAGITLSIIIVGDPENELV